MTFVLIVPVAVVVAKGSNGVVPQPSVRKLIVVPSAATKLVGEGKMESEQDVMPRREAKKDWGKVVAIVGSG